MVRHRMVWTVPALVVTLAAAQRGVAVAADGKPDFSGRWAFVKQRSDDLPRKIEEAAGPDYGVGNEKSEQARGWIRSWLEGVTDDPEKGILTIEHTATRFKAGMGDEVDIHYFGREATSRGPDGGNVKVTVAWQGDQIVTGEREAKGKGRIAAVYSLLQGGRSLLVVWRLEHPSLRQPLEVRLAFDRIVTQ